MIIETDFCDHWKIESIVNKCGESAVRCLLRLWSFCQLRKTDIIAEDKLEAIAKWNGEKYMFIHALRDVELIDDIDDDKDDDDEEDYDEDYHTYVRMHDFAKVNVKIFSNWKNGKTGGRPQKQPNQNPTETQQETETKPKQNPTPTQDETQEQPKPNPKKTQRKPIDKTDKTDRKRKVKKETSASLCVEKFNQVLNNAESEGKISQTDCFNLTKKFLEWTNYRFDVKKSPFQVNTARLHANRVIECIEVHNVPSGYICDWFQRSMENEWEGWFFEEELLKAKALIEKNNSTKTPPADAPIGVPGGALDYDMQ